MGGITNSVDQLTGELHGRRARILVQSLAYRGNQGYTLIRNAESIGIRGAGYVAPLLESPLASGLRTSMANNDGPGRGRVIVVGIFVCNLRKLITVLVCKLSLSLVRGLVPTHRLRLGHVVVRVNGSM